MSFDEDRHETDFRATIAARDAAWARVGEIDPHLLAPLVNPELLGGPAWPNLRQAFKTVRGPLGTLLASDGLSDPFDASWSGARGGQGPPVQNGLCLEVYAIGPDLPDEGAAHALRFGIVSGVAQQVADHQRLDRMLAELGTLSIELRDVPVPSEHAPRFLTEDGRVGILIGLDAPPVPSEVPGPLSTIRLCNLKLLTLAELQHIVVRGESGRDELARRFLRGPDPLLSSLTRDSVV